MFDIVIMYVVVALLFLTSVTLHIHSAEFAGAQSHGSAVSISTISDELATGEYAGEIVVSSDSILKDVKSNSLFFAVFISFVFALALYSCASFGNRKKQPYRLSVTPYFGVPLLRAPPFKTSDRIFS